MEAHWGPVPSCLGMPFGEPRLLQNKAAELCTVGLSTRQQRGGQEPLARIVTVQFGGVVSSIHLLEPWRSGKACVP